MSGSIHNLQARLEALRGPEALQALRALSHALSELDTPSRDEVLVGGPADLLLAAAMACSDEADLAGNAGRLARLAEPDLPADPVRQALVQLMIGLSAFHTGQFQASNEACDLGVQRLRSVAAPLLRAKLLAQQAVASKHLGRRDEALSQNLRALDHVAEDRSVDGIEVRATLHNNIGVLLLAQGDQPAAIRHLRRALEEAEDSAGTEAFRVMVHLNLGRLLLRGGDHPDEAAAHVERGAQLAEEVDSQTMRLRAQSSLASVRRSQGRLEEALSLLAPVIASWEQAEAPHALAEALLARGRVHLDLDGEQTEPDVVRAFELAEQSGAFDLMLEACQVVTVLLERRGRFAEACRWHARRHELEKRQYDQEKSARVEEMHARHRVEQAEHDLIEARDRAEAASNAKSGFLAITSHELRTPLNAIIGYTELLLDDAEHGVASTPDELASDLTHIHASALALHRLIDRILTLTSLGDGEGVVVPTLVDVGAHLRGTLASLEPTVQEQGNTLITVLDPSLEREPMRTDPAHLTQIVQHLVDNAAAFTDGGQVTVTAQRDGDRLQIDVQDTGTGFEPGSLNLLLRPFQQTDMSYTRMHEGLGIGLTLCRHECDLLGGHLSAISEVGVGSTFRVQLPWVLVIEEEATSATTG